MSRRGNTAHARRPRAALSKHPLATPRPRRSAPAKGDDRTWTPARDEQLRKAFRADARSAVHLVATALGWPHGFVKRRATALGLTVTPSTPSTPPETVRQRPRRRAPSDSSPASSSPASSEIPAADLRPASDEPAAGEPPTHLARCSTCHGTVKFQYTKSGRGLIVREVHGFGVEPPSFGQKKGLPLCPKDHGQMVLVDEQLAPAPEAIATTARQLTLIETAKPFNYQAAYELVEEKDDEIDAIQMELTSALKRVKNLRKDLTTAQKERTEMRQDLKRRLAEKQRADLQRAERAQEREDLAPSACGFEANTKKPCPICQAESPALVVAALNATTTVLTDVSSEAHRIAAVTANSRSLELVRSGSLVSRALALLDVYLTPATLDSWPDEQRREVLAWAKDGARVEDTPSGIGLPHLAGERGESGYQACRECGARLTEAGWISYPVEARVGLQCTGAEESPSESAATPAEASL